MEINIIQGSIDTVGSIIEIPWAETNVGTGPICQVDPVTRKPLKGLQMFEVTSVTDKGIGLTPVAGGKR